MQINPNSYMNEPALVGNEKDVETEIRTKILDLGMRIVDKPCTGSVFKPLSSDSIEKIENIFKGRGYRIEITITEKHTLVTQTTKKTSGVVTQTLEDKVEKGTSYVVSLDPEFTLSAEEIKKNPDLVLYRQKCPSSELQKRINDLMERAYSDATFKIKSTISNFPNAKIYKFDITDLVTPVITWLKDDLNEQFHFIEEEVGEREVHRNLYTNTPEMGPYRNLICRVNAINTINNTAPQDIAYSQIKVRQFK
jgi:hypothetical protein